MHVFSELVDPVQGVVLLFDVGALALDAVAQVEDVVKQGTAERENEEVGEHHLPTCPASAGIIVITFLRHDGAKVTLFSKRAGLLLDRLKENGFRMLFADSDIAHAHFRHLVAFAYEGTIYRNQVVAFVESGWSSNGHNLFDYVIIGIGNAGFPRLFQVKYQVLSGFDGTWECDATLGGNDA